MKFIYVALGALIALFPLASFVLIAVEVVMVFQIAKKHDAVHLGLIVWFCTVMVPVSFVLKFLAAWLHMIPVIGQVSNSVVAAGFIYFVYELADAHFAKAGGKL